MTPENGERDETQLLEIQTDFFFGKAKIFYSSRIRDLAIVTHCGL